MGDPIYRHALNKGGLESILSQQRLKATEARIVRGGESAVRAMNGPWHLPYKGSTPGIEFTTAVKGHPQRFGGMEGMAWYMEEGQYLSIQVTKVVYPDGRVVTYAPNPLVAKPAPMRPEIALPKQEVVPLVGNPSLGRVGKRSPGGSGGMVAGGMAGGIFALASLIANGLLTAWATGNLAGKFSRDGQRMIQSAIDAHIWRYNVLIAAHRLDILRAREEGLEVALYVVVDSELTRTNYGTAVTKAWVIYYTLLYGKNVPPIILHDYFKRIPATSYRRDGYRILLE